MIIFTLRNQNLLLYLPALSHSLILQTAMPYSDLMKDSDPPHHHHSFQCNTGNKHQAI